MKIEQYEFLVSDISNNRLDDPISRDIMKTYRNLKHLVKHMIKRYDSMISKNHAILNRLHVYKFSINYGSLRRISKFDLRYYQKIDMPCNQNLKYSSIFQNKRI